MKILISNDDGYQAPGIVALYEALKDLADVEVVAPELNNSAKSNALTLHGPLTVTRAVNGFRYVNGTANGNNGTINLVTATLTGAQLLAGTPQAMTSNSTQSGSLYGDGYTTCPTPSTQVIVGASYRRSNAANGPASATLRVTSPASLTNAAGDTIPFSQISWTVSAPGSSAPNVIPAGTFNGATQTLATIPANTYMENCHTFSYANSAVRAAGTYNGRVTYTLTSP